MLPPGYRAALLGSAASIEDLRTVAPLEEQTAEGTLMLMRLDFAEYPSPEVLGQLEGKLREAGVPPWPGYPYIVYADTSQSSVYLAWQKGVAWMPIIIGILITTLLPALLGAIIWMLLPESIKNLINMMVAVGVMVLMMSLMGKIMPGREPKRIEERTR
jgi:hypothetical protein